MKEYPNVSLSYPTVAELIAALRKMPKNAEVVVLQDDDNRVSVNSLEFWPKTGKVFLLRRK